jgi:predicted nucleic acid-binding protein
VTAASAAVFDASVLVRSVTEPEGIAAEWVARVRDGHVQGHTAELAFIEAANALLGYVRAGSLEPSDAVAVLEVLLMLPLRRHGAELATAAFSAAVELELSAYDGSYVALAESLDAPLVTADRRLAQAAPTAELVR